MTVLAPTTRDSAEMAVLGSVLLSPNALDVIHDEGVRPEHFYRAQHQAVLACMLALRDAGQAVDLLTLKARLDRPQSPVSAADLELLTAAVLDVSNLRDYCRIVRESAYFEEAAYALYDAHEATKAHDRAGLLAALARIDRADTPEPARSGAEEFMDWYDRDTKAWPLPFSALTNAIGGGMLPGEPTVLGGWSGMGKTFLLAQILRCVVKAGAKAHEYANEMHGPKRTARTLTAMTGIPAGMIEHRKLSPQQLKVVLEALGQLPYETTATAGWRVEDYCRDLRRRKWDVAAIDTVTNLPCARVDEWDRACVMLCDAAAQSGTHLILVSQLNLERDKGKKPPPVGRDLRNTGAWYQRGRVVMFIHRDQESVPAGDGSQIWRATSDGHVRIEKATHGQEAFLPVTFNPRWLRFDDLSAYSRSLEVVA